MKTKKHRTSPVLGLGLAFCVGTSSVLCVLPVNAQEQEPVAVEVTNGPTIYATDGEPLQVNTAPAKAGSADSNVPASEDTAVSTVYSTDSQSSAISEAQTAALSSNTSSGSVTVTIEEKAIVSTEDAVPSTESASVKNSSQEGNPGIAPSDDQSAANNLSEYTNCEASSESEDFLRPELETVPVPEQSLGESISSELSFADPSGEVLSQSNPVSDNSSTLAAKSVASTSAPEVKRALRIQAQPKNISTGVMASDSTELSTEEAASSVSISYIDLSKSEDQEIFSKLFKTTTTDIEVPNRYSASMTNTSMPDYSVSKCNSDLIIAGTSLETDTQTAAKTYIPIISTTRSEQFVTKAQLDDFTESTSTTVYREARESYPQTWTLMQDVTYTTIDGKVYSGKIYKRWRTTYSYEKSEDSSKRIVYGWSTVEKTEVPVYTVRTTYTCRVDKSTITTLLAGATVPVETLIRTEVPAIEGGYTLTNYSEFFTYMSREGVLGDPEPYRLAYTRASSSIRYYEEPEVIAVAIPRNATLIRTQATYYTTTASNNSVVLRGSLTDTYCWSKRDDTVVGDMITTTTVDHTVLSEQLCTLYYPNATSEPIDGTLSVYIPRYTVAPKMLYTVSYTILTTDIITTVYDVCTMKNIQTTDFDLTYDWPDKAQVYLGFDVDYNYSLIETYALTPHPNYVEKNHYFLEHVGEVMAYTTCEDYNTAFNGFFVPTIACDFVANTTGYRYFLPYSVTRTESAGLVRYFRTYYYSPVYMDETTITWETIPSMSTTTSAPAASTFTPASETITTPDSTVTTIFTILKTSIPIQSESGEVSGAMRTPLLQETTTVSAAPEILQPTQTKCGMVLGAMRTSPMAMGTPSRDAKTGDSPMLFWYLIGVLSGTAVLSAWLINEKRRSR